MYGVVLMVAMAGGAESPALFNRGCGGGSGCSGAVSHACGGHSCSGCSGCKGHRVHKSKHKGCCGVPVVNCCGVPVVGCCGAPVVGCYGAPVAPPMISHPPITIVPEEKSIEPKKLPGKEVEKLKTKPKGVENETAAPARITITVPSDAQVSIDGTATVSTETTRTFESPILMAGKSYTYTFQAEFVRDGQTVVVTREVKVQAGSEISVSFENASVVASR